MPCQLPEKPFHAPRSQPTQDARELERRDTVDAKHVYRHYVVIEHERPAQTGAPPQSLRYECNLPVREIETKVGIQKLGLIYGTERCRWRNRGKSVCGKNELSSTCGESRCRRGMLVFRAHVSYQVTCSRPRGDTIGRIQSFLERPAVIIDEDRKS